MALLKYRTFAKLRNEAKEQKLRETAAQNFKKVFNENLSKYGAKDPSELDEEQLTEFLETMKSYKNAQNGK
jgi:hypothetical protein